MKYEKPNMFVVCIEDENIITTSPPSDILDIPDTDINDDTGINGND